MPVKKAKRMTQREKRIRAQARAELRADGILPPKKKAMNRAAFCKEAEELLDKDVTYDFYPYICWALYEMLGHGGHINQRARSPEAVGVARAIKLAVRRREFEQAHKGTDEKLTVKDLYEATKDIFDA